MRIRMASLIFLLVGCIQNGFPSAGTVNFPFLSLPSDARNAGLSSASLPLVGDVTSIHCNPSGLGSVDNDQIICSYFNYILGLPYVSLGVAKCLAFGTLGAGAVFLSEGEQEKTDADNITGDTFANTAYAVVVAYGFQLRKNTQALNVGLSVKYASESTGPSFVNGFLADCGLQGIWQFNPRLKLLLGIFARNFGYAVEQAPFQFKGGLEMEWTAAGSLILKPVVSADIRQDTKNSICPGLQILYNKTFILRAGYSIPFDGSDLRGAHGLAIGIGESYKGINADVSWLPFGDLGNTFIISLGFTFEKSGHRPAPQRKRTDMKAIPVQKVSPEELQKWKQDLDRINTELEAARLSNDLDKAADLMMQARILEQKIRDNEGR